MRMFLAIEVRERWLIRVRVGVDQGQNIMYVAAARHDTLKKKFMCSKVLPAFRSTSLLKLVSPLTSQYLVH